MKIGIILVGYNMEEYVSKCLEVWKRVKNNKTNEHSFKICGICLPFEKFPNDSEDSTYGLLQQYKVDGTIDQLFSYPRNIPETQARGMALAWLKDKKVDIVWQVDLDEFYTIENIYNIINFVEFNPFVSWFRLSLKNYVFDNKTYLEEPFTPARIHRIKTNDLEASGFWADNNIFYLKGDTVVRDSGLSTLTIPKDIAFIKHYTWLNNLRSKKKIEYHEAHFVSRPSGVRSSYSWDGTRGLIFNENYFQFVGEKIPKILSD